MHVEINVEQAGEEAFHGKLGAQACLYHLLESTRTKGLSRATLAHDCGFVDLTYDGEQNLLGQVDSRFAFGWQESEAYSGDRTNLHAGEFDRRANLETVEISSEKADELVALSQKTAGAKDYDRDDGQGQTENHERADGGGTGTLSHDGLGTRPPPSPG